MTSDDIRTSEEARAFLLKLQGVAEKIEENTLALDDKQKNLVARTLELKQIPDKTKEAVTQAILEKAHLIAEAVTQAVHKDIDQIEWKVREIKRNMQNIRMWTRKTILMTLSLTFFTAFIGSLGASMYWMCQYPATYSLILNYLSTKHESDKIFYKK